MSDTPACRFAGTSIKDTEIYVPYDYYAEVRERGDLQHDPDLSALIITSYEAMNKVFRRDKTSFAHPDAQPGADYKEVTENSRRATTLFGEEHSRLHQWLALRFSPRQLSELRLRLINTVIADVIDNFASRGHADLNANFADNIPIRVVAAALDLPFDDPEWVKATEVCLDTIGAFYNKRMAGGNDRNARPKAAFGEMRRVFDPIMDAGKAGTSDDIVSQLWRDGPKLVPNWSVNVVFINITALFIDGYDTTTIAISNACKLLLDGEEHLGKVKQASDAELRNLVEKSLRLYLPVQYQVRLATDQVELSERCTLEDGQSVVPIIGAANRDPVRYPKVDKVDLNRRHPMDYFTFIQGPRKCIGAGLARFEIYEAVKQLVERPLDIRYDPSQPTYEGLVMRRFRPIHAVSSPA